MEPPSVKALVFNFIFPQCCFLKKSFALWRRFIRYEQMVLDGVSVQPESASSGKAHHLGSDQAFEILILHLDQLRVRTGVEGNFRLLRQFGSDKHIQAIEVAKASC